MAKSNAKNGRFFFGQDQYHQWYLIPESLRVEWTDAHPYEIEYADDIYKFNQRFEQYKTSSGPTSYSVLNPVLASDLFK